MSVKRIKNGKAPLIRLRSEVRLFLHPMGFTLELQGFAKFEKWGMSFAPVVLKCVDGSNETDEFPFNLP
jgi:hypothetical protein